jgi:hypothetical protein
MKYNNNEGSYLGTGFVVKKNTKHYLISNFHVFFDPILLFPEKIEVIYNRRDELNISFNRKNFACSIKDDIAIYELDEEILNEIFKLDIPTFNFYNIITRNIKKFQNELTSDSHFRVILSDSLFNSITFNGERNGGIEIDFINLKNNVITNFITNKYHDKPFIVLQENFEVSKGYSGSPIFVKTANNLYLAGMMKQIVKDKDTQKAKYYHSCFPEVLESVIGKYEKKCMG